MTKTSEEERNGQSPASSSADAEGTAGDGSARSGVGRRSWLKTVGTASVASIVNAVAATPVAAEEVAYGYGGVRLTGESEPFRENHALPGRIQAEDFDIGGAGVAYADTSDRNLGKAYRPDESVDIQPADDVGDGYNTGWMRSGEWLRYSVDAVEGIYDVRARVAAPSSGGTFRLSIAGTEVAMATVPATGGWQRWRTITLTDVPVCRCTDEVLRIDIDAGHFNLNWLDFVLVASDDTGSSTDYGYQVYGEYGYSGIA